MVSTRAAAVERHLKSPAGGGTRRGHQAQETWPRGGVLVPAMCSHAAEHCFKQKTQLFPHAGELSCRVFN